MKRRGFSIVEVLTAVAIIIVLATVFLSSDTPESKNDRERYDAAADALNNLAYAIAGYEPTKRPRSFHQVIGSYPGKLSDLTTQITTSGTNICGTFYTGNGAGTEVAKWAAKANPFYGRQLLTAGTMIAPGFKVQDALVRGAVVATSGTNAANTVSMVMPSVTLADAKGLDLAVDGVINGTLGVVQYSSTDPTSVKYIITISITQGTGRC